MPAARPKCCVADTFRKHPELWEYAETFGRVSRGALLQAIRCVGSCEAQGRRLFPTALPFVEADFLLAGR